MQPPIGISDFRILVETRDIKGNPYLFVDKTLFIKDILDDLSAVKLFTRPRRFGKTLNMSMLHHFLAREVDGLPTKSLFDHLKISQHHEYIKYYQGKFPVISITFKDIVKENQFEIAYQRFCKQISKLYSQHRYVLTDEKLSNHQKDTFISILEERATYTNIQSSLSDLTQYLYSYHGVRPWVLIDEYDAPIQTAYMGGYYDKMLSLIKGFLSAGLKDNSYLERAILTGILRVTKESIFSGLNNIETYSLLNSRYGEHFGFIEDEVSDLLNKSNLHQDMEKVKAWYNGYQSGDVVIYNPWSIVNYIKQGGKFDTYWVNVSDNALIKDLFIKSDSSFKAQFELLLKGETIEKSINDGIIFNDLENNNETALWTLFLMSGYLKITSFSSQYATRPYILSIPNKEVKELYVKSIFEWLSKAKDPNDFNIFIKHLLTGNMEGFENELQRILLQTCSIHDVKGKEPEKFYHGFMLGLVAALDASKYKITSNKESGYGRFDIAIIPKNANELAILFEIKSIVGKNGQHLQEEAKKALTQISDKKYEALLVQEGNPPLVKIGVAFSGKELAVAFHK